MYKFLIILMLLSNVKNITIRHGGIIEDIKLIDIHPSNNFLFAIYTDKDNIYTIICSEIPYFALKDTVFEYWIDYRFQGIGKKEKIYFYNIVSR